MKWLPVIVFSLLTSTAMAGEKLIIQLKDFSQTEIKGGGFTLPSDERVHIKAIGGGSEKKAFFSSDNLYAYGWVINADTRELMWKMDRYNTSRDKDDRIFDDRVYLPKGDYEIYFTAYAFAASSPFSAFSVNIDHRKNTQWGNESKKHGLFSWFGDLFDKDFEKEWQQRAKKWDIELYSDDNVKDVHTFIPPKAFSNVIFSTIRMGENEHIKQGFSISKPITIRIYALGERDNSDELADYGWIVDARSNKRIWEMKRSKIHNAGGAEKNVKYDNKILFPTGNYTLYYITDDSHSYLDWNEAPPSDPLNYGITLIASSTADKEAFKLSSVKENTNVIAEIIRVGDSQHRSENFTLKSESAIHIYALGERSNSQRQMADYGWIINAKTREKVWTMDVYKTEHAGGANKNRMIDEVITLPKGTYTVFYQTDDSHAFNDWNDSPPFDPEHWGITITGEGDNFNMSNVEKNISTKETGIIAQIIHVKDGADKTEWFRLDKPSRVRIYALGEGQNREMYDYGWIEDANTGRTIWEMTYSMTYHAGGARKNRVVNSTLFLDKGEYKLRYVSDDSHSFNNWNMDPPDDPAMWGITVYEDK
jgi:hypothetical protein